MAAPVASTSGASTSSTVPKKRVMPWDELLQSGSSSHATGSSSSKSSNYHIVGGEESKVGRSNMLTSTAIDIKQKVTLSSEQQMVLEMVLQGKNIFFTGSAGEFGYGSFAVSRRAEHLTASNQVPESLSCCVRSLRRSSANTRARRTLSPSQLRRAWLPATSVAPQSTLSPVSDSVSTPSSCSLAKSRRIELLTPSGSASKCSSSMRVSTRPIEPDGTALTLPGAVSMVDGILFDKLSAIGAALKRKAGTRDAPFGGIQVGPRAKECVHSGLTSLLTFNVAGCHRRLLPIAARLERPRQLCLRGSKLVKGYPAHCQPDSSLPSKGHALYRHAQRDAFRHIDCPIHRRVQASRPRSKVYGRHRPHRAVSHRQ